METTPSDGSAGAEPVDFTPSGLGFSLELPGFEGFGPLEAEGDEPAATDATDSVASDLPAWRIDFTPHADLFTSGNEPLLILRALATLGDAEMRCHVPDDLSAAPQAAEAPRLGWTILLQGDVTEPEIREVFDFVTDVCDLTIAPAATLATTLPICDGAKSTKTDSGYSYDLSAELPEPFRIVAADRPAGMSDAHHRAHFIQAGDPPAQIAAAADASADLAARDATAMPVVVAKAQGTPKAVAVFFSGDGGWRDLDKSIGDWLSQNGVEVLGVDSLRYFWSEKTPQQMGDDIGAILDNAMVPDGIPVAMMGYSFGADTLPFAWNSIPAGWRDRTSIIALLAPSLETGFEISIGGWFGMSTGEKPVVPQIATLPADKVLCVFGEEEGADSACTQPELARLRKIQTTGGHHCDGDYDALAARLLAAMTGTGT